MKSALIIATALMTINTLGFAASLPDGTFKGDGLWKSQKLSGEYEVSSEIRGQTVSSTYKLPDGSTKQFAMEMRPTENGFFDLVSNTKLVGKGYCLEHVILCHYEIKTDDLALEETLTVQNDKLYKFGSKTEKGFKLMWQEALGK